MANLEQLLRSAQEVLVAAASSAEALRVLHELGQAAVGLCLIALALKVGLRGLSERPRTRRHVAFLAVLVGLGLSGLILLIAPGAPGADTSIADAALMLAAGGGSLLAVLLLPSLAPRAAALLPGPLPRDDHGGRQGPLDENQSELSALYERIRELEEACSLFPDVSDHVRAPREGSEEEPAHDAEPARAEMRSGSNGHAEDEWGVASPVRDLRYVVDDVETGGARTGRDGYMGEVGERSEMTTEHEPSRPRILVVEDNRDLNRFLCRCLEQEFDVVSARNGAAGLEMALKERPDCVLTDVMMPVMGGEQLVTELRSRDELEGIPIVVLTARDDDQLRIKLLKEGVQDFITKPFLTDEVLARVRNLVAAKRAADVLSDELATKRMDLETMAREVARHRHELQTALQQMQVARDLAERASSVKSNFLRMMSHELRTPIAAMQLQLRLMEKHGAEKLEDKQREYLARISRSAQRLLDLVNTVLEYARIESGRFEARVRPFSLTKILREAADEYQSHASQKGISLTVTLPSDDMPELASDPQVVRLIAVNLIGNGVKHTEEGSVEVGASFVEGVHMLWVKDTGPGIPREHQMEVFEPFQRFEDIRQLQGAGSGLGLAIVRDMVRAVGGDISLESDVGKGALFRVTLPALTSDDDDDVRSPGSYLHH